MNQHIELKGISLIPAFIISLLVSYFIASLTFGIYFVAVKEFHFFILIAFLLPLEILAFLPYAAALYFPLLLFLRYFKVLSLRYLLYSGLLIGLVLYTYPGVSFAVNWFGAMVFSVAGLSGGYITYCCLKGFLKSKKKIEVGMNEFPHKS